MTGGTSARLVPWSPHKARHPQLLLARRAQVAEVAIKPFAAGEAHEAIVMASDGMWEFISSAGAGKIVAKVRARVCVTTAQVSLTCR
eukprot:2401467-Prymnesium_polylepis.1